MRREDLDARPDDTVLDITPEEADALAESHRLAAELPVLATIHALSLGRSPSRVLTANQVRRELAHAFGRDVVAHGTIKSREEDK